MNRSQVFWSSAQYLLSLAAVGVLCHLTLQGTTPTVGISTDADQKTAVRVSGPKRIASRRPKPRKNWSNGRNGWCKSERTPKKTWPPLNPS